jgi:hypothetical protein
MTAGMYNHKLDVLKTGIWLRAKRRHHMRQPYGNSKEATARPSRGVLGQPNEEGKGCTVGGGGGGEKKPIDSR